MAETFKLFYTQFLLRDVLGYMVPGTVVCLVFMWLFLPRDFFVVLFGNPKSKEKTGLLRFAPTWLLVLALSYLIGHSIAGLAFNMVSPNRVFAYFPYPEVATTQAGVDHTHDFTKATKTASESTKLERERYAVLLHLTGSGAAALFISALLIGIALATQSSEQRSMYAKALLVVLILAIGIWFHHRELRERRYRFEIKVIEDSAQLAMKLTANAMVSAAKHSDLNAPGSAKAPEAQSP